MVTDWQQALAHAEGLPLNPSTTDQEAAAARVTARHADSKDDLADLLDTLGLPGDEDTLTALLPFLTAPEGDDTAMPQVPTPHTPGPDAARDDTTAAPGAAVEQLLAWAEAHPLAGIRAKAARIRGDLAELTERHAADKAQHQAEQRVAKLKAELDQAQQDLRAVKQGRTTTGTAASTPGAGGGRADLAEIRAWARETGYQVADRGRVPLDVVDAYDAAHQNPTRKAG